MNARQKGQKLMAGLAKQAQAKRELAENGPQGEDRESWPLGTGAKNHLGPRTAQTVANVKANDKAAKANGKAKVVKAPAKAVGQKCLCGCGGMTKGGRFQMGHDARLKSQLINAALDPKSHVEAKRDAQAQLGKLGWTSFLDQSRKSREAREKKATA